jgi:hypothetical protein
MFLTVKGVATGIKADKGIVRIHNGKNAGND